MIRVTLDLFVVEETDEAVWISDCPPGLYRERKAMYGNREDAMEDLREMFNHTFRRMEKGRNVREFVVEAFGCPSADVEQVRTWPSAILLEFE